MRDGWLYARGVADDKGQLWMLLQAAAELAAAGRLPVNVRFACDGEEETGGHSIVEFLEADERGADACVIFDSSMLARGVPCFNLSARGMAYFHVKLRTGARDLHSGMFGGAALNALHALIADAAGGPARAPTGCSRSRSAPGSRRRPRTSWRPGAALQPGAEVLADQGARPADAKAAEEFYLRTWAGAAVDVHGIQGGSPILQKTVLPVFAEANLSIRLAPGQDGRRDLGGDGAAAARRSCRRGPSSRSSAGRSARPGSSRPTSGPSSSGLDAFERVLGVRPLLVRSGGSLPIVPALAEKGIPTVITGFDLPEGNIHSPNERLLLEYLPLGVAAARELFLGYAAL